MINERPKTFAEVVGQESAIREIKQYLKKNTLPLNMILHGESGVGKNTIAYILAKVINCKNPVVQIDGSYEPCNECSSCQNINSEMLGRDIHYYNASSVGVEQVHKIGDKLRQRPMYDKSRVIIIDEAHLIHQGRTKSTLLPIVETIRENNYLILLTTELKDFDLAFKSRFSIITLQQIKSEDIKNHLKKIMEVNGITPPLKYQDSFLNESLPYISKTATGSLRQALSWMNKIYQTEIWDSREIKEIILKQK